MARSVYPPADGTTDRPVENGRTGLLLRAAEGDPWAIAAGVFALASAFMAVLHRLQRRDLSERLAEERLQVIRQDALLFRAIVDAAEEGILMYSVDGTVHVFNERLATWLGVRPSQAIGQPIDEVIHQIVAPCLIDGHAIVDQLEHARRHRNAIESGEYVLAGPPARTIRVYSAPVRQDGQLLGRIAVATDVTDVRQQQRQLASQVRAATAQAGEAETARTDMQTFMAMVSHDLRSPLTTVLGQTQLLLRQPEVETDQLVRALRIIETATLSMSVLTSDLLDAARIGAGHFEIRREPFDLVALLAEIVDLQKQARSKCQFEFSAPDRIQVTWDRQRTRQLFVNLLTNAVKYSPNGGQISVQVQEDQREVVASVRDHGIGIAAERVPQLFLPFSGREKKTQAEGAGLGLFIAKGIVEAHGGRIGVETVPGEGSNFWVRLPIG